MKETRIAALWAACSGAGSAALFLAMEYLMAGQGPVNHFDWWLLLGAPSGSALAALLVWPHKQGAWAGAAIGFLAHPLMWCLVPLIQWATGITAPLALTLSTLLTLSVYSWILMGWITVPAGAFLGWKLAHRK
ncbi:MAG: hypothetical protein ACKV2U_12255 [Bryobacteraceae bacterium]